MERCFIERSFRNNAVLLSEQNLNPLPQGPADQAVQVVDQAVQVVDQAVQAQSGIKWGILIPEHKTETNWITIWIILIIFFFYYLVMLHINGACPVEIYLLFDDTSVLRPTNSWKNNEI